MCFEYLGNQALLAPQFTGQLADHCECSDWAFSLKSAKPDDV